jgi:uncharacterized membrane protein YdjX (TVP38/TMEM64 family)
MSSTTTEVVSENTTPKKKSLVARLAPVAVIAVALAAFFGLGLNQYFSLDALREYQSTLQGWVENNFVLTIIAFIALYALLVAIFFPGASILTIFGGFLFGLVTGTGAVLLGATLGAIINYIVARFVLRDLMEEKAGAFVKKMEDGFREDELSYMFILRLIPAFPFWAINLVAGVLGVKMRNYIIGTFFGIIPGTFVYVSIGNGVGAAFSAGEDVQLSGVILQPAILLPIIGLVVLALIPVVYKKFIAKKATD